MTVLADCLYNAISVALFGHGNASSEIHLKTFFEMSNHAMFYARVPAKTHFSHQPHFCHAAMQGQSCMLNPCKDSGNTYKTMMSFSGR
jgi:hypothetical protein